MNSKARALEQALKNCAKTKGRQSSKGSKASTQVQELERTAALREIEKKLTSAETHIEKAAQDDITWTPQLLAESQDDLSKAGALICLWKPRELEAMRKRVSKAREKLKGISDGLRRQEEQLRMDATVSQVHEKMQDAEEILAVGGGLQAVAQCEAAIKKCEDGLEQARSYIDNVEKESKAKFSEEALSHLMPELQKCRRRGEDTEKKLCAFRNETRERKLKEMVAEVAGKVINAEKQVRAFVEVVKVFQPDDLDLDTVTADSLKTAKEQSAAAEKEAVLAYNEARAIINKQKEVKEQSVLSELKKLQKKLAAAHQEMLKSRQVAKGAQEVLAMEQAVKEVEKQMPSEDQEVSKEGVTKGQINAANAAISALQKIRRSLEKLSKGASAAVMSSVNKLMTRVKEALQKAEAFLSSAEATTPTAPVAMLGVKTSRKTPSVAPAAAAPSPSAMPHEERGVSESSDTQTGGENTLLWNVRPGLPIHSQNNRELRKDSQPTSLQPVPTPVPVALAPQPVHQPRSEEVPAPAVRGYPAASSNTQVGGAIGNFEPTGPTEIPVRAGDIIEVLETHHTGWSFAKNHSDGSTEGWVPAWILGSNRDDLRH